MSDRVRVGIVGLGIGKAQGRAIHADPRGEVTALCDLDAARMEPFAAELGRGQRLFTDFDEMCAWDGIDAVFVGTPNQLHVPMALAAIRAGKHVLCTKPLADNEPAARELVRAAEASGLVGMMSLSTRHDSSVQYLGRRSRTGLMGEIYFARARSVRRSGIPDWGDHFIEAGGGAFRDMAVHALDAAWWLAGCPRPVTVLGVAGANFGPRGLGYTGFRPVAPEKAAKYAADDFGVGLIRFANGAAIQVESHWASHQPEEFQIELFGTEGGARLDPLTLFSTVDGRPADTTVQVTRGDGFAQIAAHFIACILDGVACGAPLRHGLDVQRMLEAVLESAATGTEVRIVD
jgi:predicted dehydrogenase